MYDPDMVRKARDDDEEYYRERAERIDARIADDEREQEPGDSE